jgi:hypothetical protein
MASRYAAYSCRSLLDQGGYELKLLRPVVSRSRAVGPILYRPWEDRNSGEGTGAANRTAERSELIFAGKAREDQQSLQVRSCAQATCVDTRRMANEIIRRVMPETKMLMPNSVPTTQSEFQGQ